MPTRTVHHPACPQGHDQDRACRCRTTDTGDHPNVVALVPQHPAWDQPTRVPDDEYTAPDGSTSCCYALRDHEREAIVTSLALMAQAAGLLLDDGGADLELPHQGLADALRSDGRPMTVTLVVTREGGQ